MTFEFEAFQKAKLTDIEVLSSKDREPDANPGIGLKFAATMGNDVLSLFDGALRGMIFGKSAAGMSTQQALDGIEPATDMPNLTAIGMALGQFGWESVLTGYTLTIDHGMGGKSNLEIADCVLSDFKFLGKEGGTVIVKFKLEAHDVAEKVFGKLSKLKSQEVSILLIAPVVEEQSDSNPLPFDADADPKPSDPFKPGTPEAALAEAAGLPR